MRRMILLLLVVLLAVLPVRTKAADSQTSALEIVCTGLKNGDRALYEVYAPTGKKIYSVVLQGDDSGKSVSRRIMGLDPGLYRVEGTGWNWSYDESPDLLEIQMLPGETAVFRFAVKKRGGLSRHYEDGRLNRFAHL